MQRRCSSTEFVGLFVAVILVVVPLLTPLLLAQSADLQQKLAEVKQAAAQNKQALAQYSWQQQQTIALKGEVKDTKLFQVHIGPDGQQQKVELGNTPAQAPSGGRLKQHIVKKKKGELEEYGDDIRNLADQYASPDPSKLQQAYQQGNVMSGPSGIPGEVKIVISNYVKPGDKVTLVLSQGAIQSFEVATYLKDPSDAVNIAAQYGKLPDGTNHISTMQIKGVSKELLVTLQNSNYTKVM